MIRTKKIETIFVEPSKRKMLCASLKISKGSFYNAVNGVTNSELAAKIRQEALENFQGIVIEKIKIIR